MTKPGPPGAADPPGSAGGADPADGRGTAESPDAPSAFGEPGPAAAPGQIHRSAKQWAGMFRRAEQAAVHRVENVHRPAWMRRTRGEPRWPVTATVIAAIGLQLVLPDTLALRPRFLLPALEGALLVGLIIANPVRIERRSRVVAAASLVLTLLITIANAFSAARLVRTIVEGRFHGQPVALLGAGAAVWGTNVIAFALWYWEFDRGGPIHRAQGTSPYPDLMFPQMVSPELAPPDWEPRFIDYLYMSFTNATAFSPTDVMPLARWAKLTMGVQSGVSLAVVALVVARAVNILT